MEKLLNEKNKLVVYPVPDSAVLCDDYNVFVRTQGEEQWRELSCYEVKVDMHEVRKASMT